MYPMEPLITQLVFEVTKLGVFYPCWSCEGHNDAMRKLWKIPRVWFYSDSVVHIRTMYVALGALASRKALNAPWQVVVTHSDDDNPHTTFSLEPRVSLDEMPLGKLQADIGVLADSLAIEFYKACQ